MTFVWKRLKTNHTLCDGKCVLCDFRRECASGVSAKPGNDNCKCRFIRQNIFRRGEWFLLLIGSLTEAFLKKVAGEGTKKTVCLPSRHHCIPHPHINLFRVVAAAFFNGADDFMDSLCRFIKILSDFFLILPFCEFTRHLGYQ